MGNKIKQNFGAKINYMAPHSAVALVGLFGLLLFPVSFAIDSTEAAPVQSTTTLMLTTSDISAEITPDSATGTFVASDPAAIVVRTSNHTGYTVGITASDNTNNTKLINTNDDSVYLTSISSASGPEEFNVGNWGYLPEKLNSVANSKYQPAPTTTATIIDTTSTANQNPKAYRITLGAKADYTLPTGTYENTFNVAAVANPVTYAITYDKNTEDTVTNMPADLVGDTTATSVTVSNLVPQREGYIFLGWNTAADGSGTTYNPNGGGTDLTYDINQTTANTGTLYAQWKVDKIYLQDVTTETCPTVATIVYDSRDETEYHIQKLADGRCWMLDNLALDLLDSDVLDNVTASNTNASATSLNYLKNGGGTTSDQYATAGVANWTSGDGSYSAPLVNMDDKNVVPNNAPTNGQGDNKVGGYYNFCAASAGSYCYSNDTSSDTSVGNATEDICPAGWRMPTGYTGEYVALANAIYGFIGNTSDATAAASYRNALSLPLSGFFSSGSVSYQGSSGYFWSSTSTVDTKNSRFILYVRISDVNPVNSIPRTASLPIRCIAKNTDVTFSFNANGGSGGMVNQIITDEQVVSNSNILNANTFTRANYIFTGWNTAADGSGEAYNDKMAWNNFDTTSVTLYAQWQLLSSIPFIQNITTNTCSNLPMLVYDNRDNTLYHIQKLADGKCWMLDNLALDLTNNTVLNNVSASNTNASATSLNYLKNGGGTNSNQYATAGVTNWTSSNSSTAPLVSMSSKDVVPSNAPTNSAGYNKTGGYYNFCAASAGSFCYDMFSAPMDSNAVTEDICPKNWRMPTGDNSGEYSTLFDAIYGFEPGSSGGEFAVIADFRNILSLPLSGSFFSGSVSPQGSGGDFWSSTIYRRRPYELNVTNNVVRGNMINIAEAGLSVRCIAK